MKEQISKIKESSLKEISNCKEEKQLNELRVKYLGKKGELTTVLRSMGNLTPEERPKIRKTSKWNKRRIRTINWRKRKAIQARRTKKKIRKWKYRCNRTKQKG